MCTRRCALLADRAVILDFPAPLVTRRGRSACLGALLACFAAIAHAAPKVIEESTQLRGPGDSSFFSALDVALDGNRLAIATSPNLLTMNLWVYERGANGTWSAPMFVGSASSPASSLVVPGRVALQGNVVAMTFRNQVLIAERTTQGWILGGLFTTPAGISEMGSDVEIDNGTVVVGGESGSYQALIWSRLAEGGWVFRGAVTGAPIPEGVGDTFGGDVDVSGNTIAVASTLFMFPAIPRAGKVVLFTNNGGTWVQSAELGYPLGDEEPPGWGSTVDINGDSLAIGSFFSSRLYFYRRIAGVWTHVDTAEPNDTLTSGSQAIDIAGDLIAQSLADDDRGGGSVTIYSRQGTQLRPVAELHHSDVVRHPMHLLDLSGRTLAAVGTERVLIFDLPTNLSQPGIAQDNFQDGNANGWEPFTISSWTVAGSGATRVYRQTNLASEARSLLGNSDFTNQSIAADVRPTAFNGADRWLGLATRFTDASNYYYVTLRSSNTILLRRIVNGTFETLAFGLLDVPANRTYNVRLEAVGTRLRVYVNNARKLEAIDASLSHGKAGLLTYRTQGDFDNVVVTPNPLVVLFADALRFSPTQRWTRTGDGNWIDPPPHPDDPDEPDPYANRRYLAQTSTTGGARAHAGVATDNQIVEVSVTPTTLTPTGWFGVMARYRDDGNYYYVKVGAAGETSIRKLVNGTIFELAKTPFPVATNAAYKVRLEVIGTRLRAYVNDRFLVEAIDTSHATGKYGIVTYKAAARFTDFTSNEP